MIVPTVCFVAFVFERKTDCVIRVIWHYLFFSYTSKDVGECMQGLRSVALKISIGRPLIPDALPTLFYLTISRLIKVIHSYLCGIKSRAAG